MEYNAKYLTILKRLKVLELLQSVQLMVVPNQIHYIITRIAAL